MRDACHTHNDRMRSTVQVAFAAYSCLHFSVAYVAVLVFQWRSSASEVTHTPLDESRGSQEASGAKLARPGRMLLVVD
jgi:hypothetical protein